MDVFIIIKKNTQHETILRCLTYISESDEKDQIVQIQMKPFWNAQHIFQKVIKRIELCKSANFEKSIRVNGYIDNNEKMKPFWNVQHPVQKSKWPNLANPQILKKSIRENECFHHNEKKHKMKPSWDAQHTLQKVMKRIKSCKSTNLEKSIRVNEYIDHNEKNTMKPFWHVKHPAQKVMKRIKSYKSANVFLVHYSNRTTSRGTGPPPTQCIFNSQYPFEQWRFSSIRQSHDSSVMYG